MSGYPNLTDIEVEWRKTGSGVCIIVEGETAQDDPWFYGQWFDEEARRFTFFPQDGYEKVGEAVAALRSTLGGKRVYGIRDRDFDEIQQPGIFPSDGLLMTHKYTLENYLLDAGIWYKIVRPFVFRNPRPGWNSADEIQQTILNMYRMCFGLSAFNWALRFARQENNAGFSALAESEKKYKEHPRALPPDTPAYLLNFGQRLGLQAGLRDRYLQRLTQLQNSNIDEWEQAVSGKYVLKLLKEHRPNLLGTWDDALGAYMSYSVEPPIDLKNLLDQIYQHTQTP